MRAKINRHGCAVLEGHEQCLHAHMCTERDGKLHGERSPREESGMNNEDQGKGRALVVIVLQKSYIFFT